MKTLLLSVLVAIPALSLRAEEAVTPSRCVEESFFGSNPTAYALLRTETEVTDPSGAIRSRTWIDEYAKERVLLSKEDSKLSQDSLIKSGRYQSKLTRSTLLLDLTKPPLAAREKEDDTLPDAVNVDDENTTVLLAAMLLRYPSRSLARWTTEQMEPLVENGFFVSYKNQTLVSGQLLRARMGDAPGGDAGLHKALGSTHLMAVDEDDNCLYLTYTTTNPANKQTRVFCVLPDARMNVRHLSLREPLYLLAGRFDTKDEAFLSAKVLRERLDEKKELADLGLQVWEVYHSSYSRDFYYIVLPKTEEIIRKERVVALESHLGKRLPIVRSDSFSVMLKDLSSASR